MGDPVFQTRDGLATWARQRLRYPDPTPDEKLRALDDIKRVTLAHVHLSPTPTKEPRHDV